MASSANEKKAGGGGLVGGRERICWASGPGHAESSVSDSLDFITNVLEGSRRF